MKFYQTPSFQYPDVTRMVGYVSPLEYQKVLEWLNLMAPDKFVIIEDGDGDGVEVDQHWFEIYFKESDAAMLFKMAWDVVKP